MANRNLYRFEMLVLKILEENDCYGYEIIQTLKERSKSQIIIAEGTLYNILYKLSNQEFISNRKEQIGKRQIRVYYHLEEAGKSHLERLMQDFYGMIDTIQSILTYNESKK